MHLLRRSSAFLAVLLVLGALSPAASAAPSDPRRASADRAGDYVASRVTAEGFITSSDGTPTVTNTVRAAVALGTSGRGQAALQRALDFLSRNVDGATQYQGLVRPGGTGLTIVAVVAGGKDPRSFGGVDLVSRLLSAQTPVGPDAGKFRDPLFDGVLNHAIATIGLRATGLPASDPRVRDALAWLTSQQCPDGAFQNAGRNIAPTVQRPCTGGDVDTTGYAVQALRAFGVTPTQDAVAWLRSEQAADASFGGNADSTGLAASALASLGQDTRREAAWLRGVQQDDGAFRYTADEPGDLVYATEEALPGQLGVLRPSAPVRFRTAAPARPAAPTVTPATPARDGSATAGRGGAALPVTGGAPPYALVGLLLAVILVRRWEGSSRPGGERASMRR